MINKKLIAFLQSAIQYVYKTVFWNWFCMLMNVGLVTIIAVISGSLFTGDSGTESFSSLHLGIYIPVLLVIILARWIAQKMTVRNSFMAAKDVKRSLREKLYRKLLRIGASYQEKVPTSEVLQVSMEGVEQLEVYFGQYLPQFFYSMLAPVTLFIILSFVSLKASIVLLLCVPLIPMSIVAVQKFAKKLLKKYWGKYTDLGDSFLENLQGLTTLKIYQADHKAAEKMDEDAENFRKITMKVLTMQLNSITIMDLIAYGGAAVGILLAVLEYQAGNIGFAGAVMIILLSSEFFIPLRLLGSFFHIAMNGQAASDKIFRILELEENEERKAKIPVGQASIQFKKLHFAYSDHEEVLKGIDLEIKSKQMVSIVGESGSGKSTIASLIMGMHTAYSGKIQIAGIELREVTEESIMNHITMVSHNSYLFQGTIEETLRMGKPDASIEEMTAVLKKVRLYDFLEKQEGIKTKIAEKASNLSGGQCQRLALARALLHDTDIYIFDEATSNIDIESENLIMGVILELAREKTVIMISHRLENVVASDRIYVLEDGRIVGMGTHTELLEDCSVYNKMYQLQKQMEMYGMDEKKEELYA